jgi:hypothetical protein
MYLRWIVDLSPQQEAGEKIGHIIDQNRMAKSKVLQLRRKLLDLENEAEKMGILERKQTENITSEGAEMALKGEHTEVTNGLVDFATNKDTVMLS